MRVERELAFCHNCAQLIANGEINDGTDQTEITSGKQVERWGDDVLHLVLATFNLGDENPREFDCDGCGDTVFGELFQGCFLGNDPDPTLVVEHPAEIGTMVHERMEEFYSGKHMSEYPNPVEQAVIVRVCPLTAPMLIPPTSDFLEDDTPIFNKLFQEFMSGKSITSNKELTNR